MAPVLAVLSDGRTVELDPKHGSTIDEVVDGITKASLTGSAVPLSGVKLTEKGGGEFEYSLVNTFAEAVDHEP